jgi:hypothetical protein
VESWNRIVVTVGYRLLTGGIELLNGVVLAWSLQASADKNSLHLLHPRAVAIGLDPRLPRLGEFRLVVGMSPSTFADRP